MSSVTRHPVVLSRHPQSASSVSAATSATNSLQACLYVYVHYGQLGGRALVLKFQFNFPRYGY